MHLYNKLHFEWISGTYNPSCTPKSLYITLNPNGGSVTPTTKSVTYGGTYGNLPTPTRSGYTFLGWFTSATGGTQITSASKIVTTSNQTIYAHWKKLSFIVTYDANGGDNVPLPQTFNYGEGFELSSIEPRRSGYEFLGWYPNDMNATSAIYKYIEREDNTITSYNGNITLYAVWKEENKMLNLSFYFALS